MRSTLGDGHPDKQRLETQLFMVYLAAEPRVESLAILIPELVTQRKLSEAEPLLREWVFLLERIDADDWMTAYRRGLLGETLSGLGRFAEAEPLLLASQRELDVPANAVPPRYRREAVSSLVWLYESWGKPEEAERWRREVAVLLAEPALPEDVFAGSEAGR